MKPILTAAAAALAFAGTAWAQTDLDTNADGVVTLEELQAVYPDVTEDMFAQMDTDASGDLSAEEITAAIEAGMLTSG